MICAVFTQSMYYKKIHSFYVIVFQECTRKAEFISQKNAECLRVFEFPHYNDNATSVR